VPESTCCVGRVMGRPRRAETAHRRHVLAPLRHGDNRYRTRVFLAYAGGGSDISYGEFLVTAKRLLPIYKTASGIQRQRRGINRRWHVKDAGESLVDSPAL
jgi:hypothetical protein